uniref:Bm51 n=1 Tax=Brugia malayi TaxID=6279 RepID=A0A1I9FZP4_BRUMA|nr:Bm51 [Brugia malayi]
MFLELLFLFGIGINFKILSLNAFFIGGCFKANYGLLVFWLFTIKGCILGLKSCTFLGYLLSLHGDCKF